ncbi:MAG: histidine phosphatase family protein [Microthrixaceae bacterium]
MSASGARSLVWVRHGRTTANASGLLLGRADPPLDELGRVQATAVAAAIRSGRFGPVLAVVSSPLDRARRTAEAIGAPVQVDERLIELDYGELDGTPVADVPGELWAEWRADIGFRPPGGESLEELGRRVHEACAEWSERVDRPGAIVLVSHVSPIKAALSWALSVGDDVAWRSHLDPASITRILLRGGGRALGLFNETAHLEGVPADREESPPA